MSASRRAVQQLAGERFAAYSVGAGQPKRENAPCCPFRAQYQANFDRDTPGPALRPIQCAGFAATATGLARNRVCPVACARNAGLGTPSCGARAFVCRASAAASHSI